MTRRPVPTSVRLTFDTSGYDRSLTRDRTWSPLRVQGELPRGLRGTLYRNGPLARESQGVPVGHLFEGDGGIAAVRFSDDGVLGAARVLSTRARREEARAARPLYGFAAPWSTRLWSAWTGRVKNAANTHVVPYRGELLALYEGGLPTRVDPDTFDVLGETDFDGAIPSVFSAHPHHVVARNAMYNFGLVYGRETRLDLFELPLGEGPVRRLGQVVLPRVTILHDFVATENHLVFFVSPVRVNLLRALALIGPLERLLQWAPQEGAEVIVVPIDAPTRVTRFTVPAFFQWHFANAFDEGDEIVVDYCRRSSFSLQIDMDDAMCGRLTRARLNPARGTFEETVLSAYATDMPRVHPSVEGSRHRVVYTVGAMNGKTGLRHRLCRLDVDGIEAFIELEPGQLVSEPVVVPRSDAEHDAWLITLVYDGSSHTSFWWIVDATTMESQAKCWLDYHIPLTFHGTWCPS